MSKRRTSLFVFFVLLALPIFAAPAGDSSPKGGRIDVAGLQASVDPATGKLRQPTLEERRALAAAFTTSLSIQKIVPRTSATGAISVALDDRFMNFYIARVTEEGQVTFDCVNNADGAAAVLAAPPSVMRRPAPEPRTAPAVQIELETE